MRSGWNRQRQELWPLWGACWEACPIWRRKGRTRSARRCRPRRLWRPACSLGSPSATCSQPRQTTRSSRPARWLPLAWCANCMQSGHSVLLGRGFIELLLHNSHLRGSPAAHLRRLLCRHVCISLSSDWLLCSFLSMCKSSLVAVTRLDLA